MNNYRVTYLHDQKCDYWCCGKTDEGKKVPKGSIPDFHAWPGLHYPLVRKIIDRAKSKYGIKYIWFFYEPFIEITWLDDNPKNSERLISSIRSILRANNITDAKYHRPKDGSCGDWYCKSDAEREFGARRHAVCEQWVTLYNDYKEAVDNGKGLEYQVGRTIHTLCNPLGLNFRDEAKICLRRGIQCWCYGYLPGWMSRFILKKVLRYKDLNG